jgi:hypothetical protein
MGFIQSNFCNFQQPVRKVAMSQLSILYGTRRERLGNKWANERTLLSWIPTKIINCYNIPEIQDRLRIEKEIDLILLSEKATAEERAQQLMEIVSSLNPQALTAFARLLKDKQT